MCVWLVARPWKKKNNMAPFLSPCFLALFSFFLNLKCHFRVSSPLVVLPFPFARVLPFPFVFAQSANIGSRFVCVWLVARPWKKKNNMAPFLSPCFLALFSFFLNLKCHFRVSSPLVVLPFPFARVLPFPFARATVFLLRD